MQNHSTPRCGAVQAWCEQCGQSFRTRPSVIARGQGRFCSLPCHAQYRRATSAIIGKTFLAATASDIPVGLCQCGCGQQTSVPTMTNVKLGRFRGQPLRFVQGHGYRCKSNKTPKKLLSKTPQKLLSTLDRFWQKVDKTGPCWLWTGRINENGYGTFSIRHKAVYAHRFAYEVTLGPIPEGLELDHTCHTTSCRLGINCPHRRCVNPFHLEPVSRRVNALRGNAPSALAVRTGFCKRGHPLVESNIYHRKNGHRMCRPCCLDRSRQQRANHGFLVISSTSRVTIIPTADMSADKSAPIAL